MTHAAHRPHPGTIMLALLIAAFFLLPIAYLVSVSFKTPDDILSGRFLPTHPTLANWPAAFQTTALPTFIVNSALVSVVAGLVAMAITLPAAYATTRLGVGKGWLGQATLASYVAPPVVALIPLFYLLKAVGLINTTLGIGLVLGLANIPVAFWLITPFLRKVPYEIEEAAMLDGCGPWARLVRIVVPLILPGLVTTTLIVMVLANAEFLYASTFSFKDETRTLTVGISLFQGERLQNFGQMAVASLSGVLPIYLLALFAQRWLIEGLTTGSMK